MAFSWVGPLSSPPDNNTPAPINVSGTSQTKTGALWGDGGFFTQAGGYFAGVVGIGDATPDGGLKLDVEGNVGAKKYCDENGNNCFNAVNAAALLGDKTIVTDSGYITTTASTYSKQITISQESVVAVYGDTAFRLSSNGGGLTQNSSYIKSGSTTMCQGNNRAVRSANTGNDMYANSVCFVKLSPGTYTVGAYSQREGQWYVVRMDFGYVVIRTSL